MTNTGRLVPAGLLCLLIAACSNCNAPHGIQAFVLTGRQQRIGRSPSTHVPSPAVPGSIPISSSSSSSSSNNSNNSGAGPKSSGRRRTPRSGPRGTASSSATGPKSSSPSPRSIGPRSAPQRRRNDHPGQIPPAKTFDGKALTAVQTPNLDAPRFDLRPSMANSNNDNHNDNNNRNGGDASAAPAASAPVASASSDREESTLRCVTPGLVCSTDKVPEAPSTDRPCCYEYRSLDDLLDAAKDSSSSSLSLPEGFSLSELFNSDEVFRNDLRSAIRLDVFETTPFYANLPEKARTVLLLPDSSLEGSWRIPEATSINDNDNDDNSENNETATPNPLRMKHTTRVLNAALEQHRSSSDRDESLSSSSSSLLSGDDLFRAIGSLCGSGASTHWIDIHGVQDRAIPHSWHLDAGRSPDNCRTVLWGFPPENHYEGTGVFSHVVGLEEPFDDLVGESILQHNRMEPVLFEGHPPERCVVRPGYASGRELLLYRDVDVLHSAPDVAYRTSVMRFM